MKRLLPTALLTCLILTSGCISLDEPPQAASQPNDDEADASTSAQRAQANEGRHMSANATSATTVGPCPTHEGSGRANLFCATRTHWVAGNIDLVVLPVQLKTFNGNLNVQGGRGGEWNLTAVLRARGDSEATARANLANIEFDWSHRDGPDYRLHAEARRRNPSLNAQEQASMALLVPASVRVDLVGATTNGNAQAAGLIATGVRLSTTNGAVVVENLQATRITLASTNGAARVHTVQAQRIDVETTNGAIHVVASAKDYHIKSSNGPIEARLRPSGSGDVTIKTTNGAVSLGLPEAESFGHDVAASTTNGRVSISLEDGDASGSATSKTFKTDRYASRAIQTKTLITTTNAIIDVSPL